MFKTTESFTATYISAKFDFVVGTVKLNKKKQNKQKYHRC